MGVALELREESRTDPGRNAMGGGVCTRVQGGVHVLGRLLISTAVTGRKVLGKVGEVSGLRFEGTWGKPAAEGEDPDRSALRPPCPQWPWPAGTWSSLG